MSNFEKYIRDLRLADPTMSITEAVSKYDDLPNTVDFDFDPVGWTIVQPKIVEAMKNGKNIAAIKELRAAKGLSLLEAKNIIDQVRILF